MRNDSFPTTDDALAAVLARFLGASFVARSASEPVGVDETQDPNEPHYGVAGPGLRAMGWNVFPQTRGYNSRPPGSRRGG